MSANRDVAAQFRKGAARRAAGRADPASAQPDPAAEAADVDALLARNVDPPADPTTPSTEPASGPSSPRTDHDPGLTPRSATDLRSVRSMFVPEEAARGMRVLAMLRELDHADVVLDAARSCADQIAPAETHVSRRRRVRTERLQLKLSDAETTELDDLATARNMTRSSYLSEALERYVAAANDRLPGRIR